MAVLTPDIVTLQPQEAIAVGAEVPLAELPAFFAQAFHEAVEAATESRVQVVGPPFGYYPRMPGETVAVEAGFPVSAPVRDHGRAHRIVLPGGRAVEVVHVGGYDTMHRTYADLQRWMAEEDIHPIGPMWECYLSDPQAEPDPSKWRTRIVCPIR